MAKVDIECGAQLAGAVGEVLIATGFWSARSQFIETFEWLDTSQQHGLGVADRAGDNVGTVVHTVGEVDVQHTGRAEHHCVARRLPAGGVTGGIVDSTVGLHLVDPTPARSDHQELAEQFGRHHGAMPGEE